MLTEIKYALRSFCRAPGFPAIAILTLALGIGLNTAMFSLINAFLFRPLGYSEGTRLFNLNSTRFEQKKRFFSVANFFDLQEESRSYAQLAGYQYWTFTLADPGRPAEALNSFRVTGNFLSTLRVHPLLGRDFRPDEDRPNENHVVILSYRLWQTHFGGDASIVGKTVRLDGEPTEVVGVLPESALKNVVFGMALLLRPSGLTTDEKRDRSLENFMAFGRYASGVTAAQAKARFTALANRLAADYPKENKGLGLGLTSLQSVALGESGAQISVLLLLLSGFVLLIACANLANLLLARAIARAREFAVRAALGASRLQLIRPIAFECLCLATIGGVLGIVVANWTSAWMAQRFSRDGIVFDFGLDWRVVAFALFASFATALFFGITPAWVISRVRVNETLKSGTRGSTANRSHNRFRQLLIISQFALALVLLAGAGLFLRGVNQFVHRHNGWNPTPLLSGTVSLPTNKYSNPERTYRFYLDLENRLSQLPGVKRVAISTMLPLSGFDGPRPYTLEGKDPTDLERAPTAATNMVSTDYFSTVGTKLLQGRLFTATDLVSSPQVVVVNEAMAKALYPNGNALGHRLARAGAQGSGWAEIVGVVEDVSFFDLSPLAPKYQVYKPLSQETWNYVNVTLRLADAQQAPGLIEPFRHVVASLDSDLPVIDLLPVPEQIARDAESFTVLDDLLVGFALLGLFLAGLGIYGLIAHVVVQRTGEIGIRMALGAQFKDIMRLIVGTGLRIAAVGSVLGLMGAALLTHFINHAMPRLSGANSVPVLGATVLLMGLALIASWLPARRAAKLHPMVALRSE